MKIWVLALASVLAAWSAAAQEHEPARVAYTAVQAAQENRDEPYFDRALRDARDAIEHLGYDTYRYITSGSIHANYGQEAELELTDRYTLYVTPLSKERDGRIRAEIRVTKERDERDEDGNPIEVNALRTTSRLVPGDELCLGAFDLEEGDLVIVLVIGAEE